MRKTIMGNFKNFATAFLVSICVFFFAWPAAGADFCVNDSAGLQTVLTTAAGNGQDDTIRIVQGTYIGNFIYSSLTETYNLAVEGGYTAGCASRVVDPANTVLDGNNANTVLVFSTGQTVDFSVDGVTLQNGSAALNGGGLYINYTSSGNDVTITNSIVSNNTAGTNGGGVYINPSDGNVVTITDSIISNNIAADEAGGIYIPSALKLFNLANNVISGNNGRGVYVRMASSATISGNLIDNNKGGAYIASSDSVLNSTVTFAGNTVRDNTDAGGAYIAGFHTSNITGNIIRNNQGLDTGGIKIYGVTTGTTPTMNLTNNTIDYNSVSDNHKGAGVHIKSGAWAEVTFTGNTISNNNGSGVRTEYSTATFNNNNISDNIGVGVKIEGPATFINNTITGNTSKVYGGGIAISGYGTFSNNTITGNTSTKYRGGGVYCGAATFTGNIISDNSGGGVYAMPDKYGAYSITFTNNTITGNTAGSGVAVDALYDYYGIIYGFDSATFINNTITGNSAPDDGAGVYSFYTRTITLTNNTITGNTAGNDGGGIRLFLDSDSAGADIYNNIIWNNSAAAQGTDIWIDNDGNLNYLPSLVNLFNNDFDRSSSGTYIKIPFVIDPGNLDNLDPLFINPAGGDYHLLTGSPVVDMGDNNAPAIPATDKDGNPRIVNSIVDMGAYEYGSGFIYFDDFNDGNDNGWTVKSGTWTVTGGQYSETSAYSPPGVSVVDNTTNDMTIGVSAKDPGTGGFRNFFIVFAYDEANGKVYWAGARIGNVPPGAWTIEEVNLSTGSGTWLAETYENINIDTWYDLKLVINGDTVTLYADGAEKVSYTFPGGMPAGRIGLGGQNNQALFDNFVIDTDGDGIADDGDGSGIVGDNRCTGGNTANCDDNCRLTANSGQQDTDADGYGNMCDADLDNDGFVGPFDFNIFKAAWGSTSSSANWNVDADFDSDSFVGPFDFNVFKVRWGTTAPWE